jgi:phosphatidylglycerol:prolipoprotein diacylglycerol transferase
MLVLAFVGSYLQLRWGLKELGIGDDDDASSMVLAAGVGGILGAKVYYVLLYQDWRLLFSRSGLVWYGGFLLAAALVVWVVHHRKMPRWRTIDAAAPALALGYGIGRIGCFLVGDDYGVPTNLPWGVVFKHGVPKTTAENISYFYDWDFPAGVADSDWIAVHPTQIYETLIALGIWWIGLKLLRRSRVGTTSVVVFSLLAMERFFIEFFRAKDDRLLGEFTVAQAISVGILLVMVVLWRLRPAAEPPGGGSHGGTRSGPRSGTRGKGGGGEAAAEGGA